MCYLLKTTNVPKKNQGQFRKFKDACWKNIEVLYLQKCAHDMIMNMIYISMNNYDYVTMKAHNNVGLQCNYSQCSKSYWFYNTGHP